MKSLLIGICFLIALTSCEMGLVSPELWQSDFSVSAARSIGVSVDVEQNKIEHRAAAIANAWGEDTTQVILAYEGETLDTSTGGGLDQIFDRLAGDDPDFGMISLVRILYLSDMHDNYSYDSTILPLLEGFQYWPTADVPVEYCYWSENHLIMWLSTAYLLE